MLLAIDIGNTTIHFALFMDTEILSECRVPTLPVQTVEEYEEVIKNLSLFIPKRKENIFVAGISSVVAEAEPNVTKAVGMLTKRTPVKVSKNCKTPISGFSSEMPDLGADRIANAAAAITNYDLPVLIVDVGTAITFCVIDENRQYVGGAIAPGIRISSEALFQKVSSLKSVNLTSSPSVVIGKTTEENICSGILFGQAGMVDGMIARIEAEFGSSLKHIATGGNAALLVPLCNEELELCEKLTLNGIRIVANMNIKGTLKNTIL